MALKKSEIYGPLWSICDSLRGPDASHYKDYVLVLLFIKYVSDRFAGEPYAAITVPKGASFQEMVALKGKPDIGDQINTKIIAPLVHANKLSYMPDFNDDHKLGSGKESVDRITAQHTFRHGRESATATLLASPRVGSSWHTQRSMKHRFLVHELNHTIPS